MNDAHEKKEFDKLVVIAAPRALGSLRAALPKGLAGAIVKEMDHDLTGFPTPALETYLREHDVI